MPTGIEPISFNPFVQPAFNDQPITPIKRVIRELPHSKDSIEIMEVANWIADPAAFKHVFSTSPLFGKTAFHRHILEKPQIDIEEMETLDEMNHLLIEEVENTISKQPPEKNTKEAIQREVSNLFLFINCLNLQDKNYQENDKITFEFITKCQEYTEKLINEYLTITDEIISREKSEDKLSWVNWIFDAGLILSGIASLALLILTEGAALPAIIVYFDAFLSVSSGSIKITKGYLDYLNQKAQGLISEIDFKRYFNSDKIRSSMKDMEDSMNKVYEALDLLEDVIRNRQYIKPFK